MKFSDSNTIYEASPQNTEISQSSLMNEPRRFSDLVSKRSSSNEAVLNLAYIETSNTKYQSDESDDGKEDLESLSIFIKRTNTKSLSCKAQSFKEKHNCSLLIDLVTFLSLGATPNRTTCASINSPLDFTPKNFHILNQEYYTEVEEIGKVANINLTSGKSRNSLPRKGKN